MSGWEGGWVCIYLLRFFGFLPLLLEEVSFSSHPFWAALIRVGGWVGGFCMYLGLFGFLHLLFKQGEFLLPSFLGGLE